ncbi:polyhydroxyalkanoic acid system family protein [Chitinimonas sp.]|uniref:polyhydroxyalkanoic acid system family protein n=1 Tax=Chitinimonas sp. TaxID=1934313 RepID=UPI0035B4A4AB
MSIHIRRPHSKPHDEARQLAEQVANQLKAEFSMDWNWDGDVLHFKRSGVNGSLTVAPDEIVVQAKLGFLLSAIQPKVESEINRFLDERFG